MRDTSVTSPTSVTFHNGQHKDYPDTIFVFGSNLAGRHGKGAALYAAQNCGAKYGEGVGMYGKSYAIPTKDKSLSVLSLTQIKKHVDMFKLTAYLNQSLTFFITPIGTGLAGYSHEEIAPMFKGCPENCILPGEWRKYLE